MRPYGNICQNISMSIMLRPKAVNAFALDDFRILVGFDTGERKSWM